MVFLAGGCRPSGGFSRQRKCRREMDVKIFLKNLEYIFLPINKSFFQGEGTLEVCEGRHPFPLTPTHWPRLRHRHVLVWFLMTKRLKVVLLKAVAVHIRKRRPRWESARGGIGLRNSESPPLAEENTFPR